MHQKNSIAIETSKQKKQTSVDNIWYLYVKEFYFLNHFLNGTVYWLSEKY